MRKMQMNRTIYNEYVHRHHKMKTEHKMINQTKQNECI